MARVLGRRKLRAASQAAPRAPTTAEPVSPGAADDASDTDIQAIFRRHFEAQFQPLQVGKQGGRRASDDDGREEDGWSGLSEEDDDSDSDSDIDDGSRDADIPRAVEVVDYSQDDSRTAATMTKQERKAYLSSRPLSTAWSDASEAAKPPKPEDGQQRDADYKDAPDLLANDLALQRLLAESHLLSQASPFAVTSSLSAMATTPSARAAPLKSERPFATGRLRQRATDLRIQAAATAARSAYRPSPTSSAAASSSSSSASSPSLPLILPTAPLLKQAKMPMATRKGIVATAAAREAKRRREARESGIVLERPAAAGAGTASSSKKAKDPRKRVRAVDAPAVGRLRGSELRLSARDVRAIEGPRKTPGFKKRKRR